jgi:hypothetical protein
MNSQLFCLKGPLCQHREQQFIQFLQYAQARAKLRFHQQRRIDGNKLIGHKRYSKMTLTPHSFITSSS